MIAGKIKEMKIRSGMTNQQVADKSGVPIGTVNRVMADQVQNPDFETVSAIVMALGGSIGGACRYWCDTLMVNMEQWARQC